MKGALLLELAALYPYLKTFVREEILSHRIDLDLLPASPLQDDYRPRYTTLRPNFLSPLAFDYINARTRFSFSLGPKPWVQDNFYSRSSVR